MTRRRPPSPGSQRRAGLPRRSPRRRSRRCSPPCSTGWVRRTTGRSHERRLPSRDQRPGRTVRRVPLLGSLAGSRPAQDLRRTVRAARATSAPLRFVAMQLGSRRAARYRLRGSGLTVFLRHGTRDVDIFREIFGVGYEANSYDPPEPVAAALDASAAPAVLDLGGNIGLFGAYMLGRWPGATVRSFEPDPTNLPILRRVIAVNGLPGRWTVTPAAVANEAGELPFVLRPVAASSSSSGRLRGARTRRGVSARAQPTSRPGPSTSSSRARGRPHQDGHRGRRVVDPHRPAPARLRAGAIVLERHAAGCPSPTRCAALRLCEGPDTRALHEPEDFGHRGVLWAWREDGRSPRLATAQPGRGSSRRGGRGQTRAAGGAHRAGARRPARHPTATLPARPAVPQLRAHSGSSPCPRSRISIPSRVAPVLARRRRRTRSVDVHVSAGLAQRRSVLRPSARLARAQHLLAITRSGPGQLDGRRARRLRCRCAAARPRRVGPEAARALGDGERRGPGTRDAARVAIGRAQPAALACPPLRADPSGSARGERAAISPPAAERAAARRRRR